MNHNITLVSLSALLGCVLCACSSDPELPTSTSSGAGGTASSTSGSGVSSASGGGGAPVGDAGPDGDKPWDAAIDPSAGPSSERLTEHQLGSGSAPQGFYEYLPPGYPGGAKWPLLFALHGVGENGNGTTELKNALNTGIGSLLKNSKWPNDRPFLVLLPQHPGGGCPSAEEIKAFITWGMASYDIDPAQVYLTGLSCGGIGSWDYLRQNLDSQIAAMVPIAADGKGAWGAKMCELGKVPIWAFHGDKDPTVDVSGTHVPMDGLASCPAPPRKDAKKTIYPGVQHDSWNRTYDLSAGNDIYTWMLSFKHE